MEPPSYGRTASGKPITDELVEKLADKAEAGYDVEQTLRRRGGRPPIGSAAASVESVRLDPELREALAAGTRARARASGFAQAGRGCRLRSTGQCAHWCARGCRQAALGLAVSLWRP
jgi:hypothetical protein